MLIIFDRTSQEYHRFLCPRLDRSKNFQPREFRSQEQLGGQHSPVPTRRSAGVAAQQSETVQYGREVERHEWAHCDWSEHLSR